MRRHFKTVHVDFKDDETIDDRENPEIIAEDNASDKADDNEPNIKDKAETDDIDIDVDDEEEEEEEAEEEEEDKEEDSDNPWRILIQEAFERCLSEFERVTVARGDIGVDQDDAQKLVYYNMLPAHGKGLANSFVTEMLWFHAMRKDPIFLSMKTTVSDLKLLEDYDNEGAWKSAVNERNFV